MAIKSLIVGVLDAAPQPSNVHLSIRRGNVTTPELVIESVGGIVGSKSGETNCPAL